MWCGGFLWIYLCRSLRFLTWYPIPALRGMVLWERVSIFEIVRKITAADRIRQHWHSLRKPERRNRPLRFEMDNYSGCLYSEILAFLRRKLRDGRRQNCDRLPTLSNAGFIETVFAGNGYPAAEQIA